MSAVALRSPFVARMRVLAWGCGRGAIVVSFVVTVAGFLAQFHRFFDIVTCFAAWCLAAALISLPLAVTKRSIPFAVASAFVIVVQTCNVLPLYVGRSRGGDGHRDFRIMTANLHDFDSASCARFVELVRRERPDMFSVEEMTPEWLEGLKALFDAYPYRVVEAKANVLRVGLFSRYPLANTRLFWMIPDTYGSIWAEAHVGGRKVTLLAVHAVPPWRIGWPVSRAEWAAKRNATFAAIPHVLESADGACVVFGDHNVTMWSPHYAAMTKRARLANARKGFGIVPTWPTLTWPFRIPIDQCLYRGPLRVIDCRAGSNFGSDHLPLLCDFALEGDCEAASDARE